MYEKCRTSLRHYRSQNNRLLFLKGNHSISGYYQPVYLHLWSPHMIFKWSAFLLIFALCHGPFTVYLPHLMLIIIITTIFWCVKITKVSQSHGLPPMALTIFLMVSSNQNGSKKMRRLYGLKTVLKRIPKTEISSSRMDYAISTTIHGAHWEFLFERAEEKLVLYWNPQDPSVVGEWGTEIRCWLDNLSWFERGVNYDTVGEVPLRDLKARVANLRETRLCVGRQCKEWSRGD